MLEGDSYHLYYRVVKAVDFGIPQKRERVIIIGTTINDVDIDELWDVTIQDMKKEYPTYFDKVTVKDAISNLPSTTKDGIVTNPIPTTEYQKLLSSSKEKLTNHTMTSIILKLAIDRIKRVDNGENFTSLKENIKSVHSGSYGRLCWDEQAPTITTRFDTPAGGRFIHPGENATLTPRSCKNTKLPDDFVFMEIKLLFAKR